MKQQLAAAQHYSLLILKGDYIRLVSKFIGQNTRVTSYIKCRKISPADYADFR
jgi:hypothetical protein